MKKQIILLKGWEAKENFKDFYDFVEKQEFNPYEEKQLKWSDILDKTLREDFEVIKFPRPNYWFADYKAWKIMFEKVTSYLKDDFILLWHSLGGTFLVKYLQEDDKFNLWKKASKIILVAPAYKDDEKEVLGNFNFSKPLNNLKKIQEKIIIFWSKDDFIVDFSDIEDFKKELPKAKFMIFEDKGHFLQEDFVELVEEFGK